MMQRIEIKNFGPINNVNMQIQDIMLFVGPQANGKSTIAKIIYFFKSLNDELVKYCKEALEKNDFVNPETSYSKVIRKKFLDYFGASVHLDHMNLTYHYSDDIWIAIELELNNKYISPLFSKSFQFNFFELINTVKNFSTTLQKRNLTLLTSKDLLQADEQKKEFLLQIKSRCNALFQENRELIFIPAGRSLLATLTDQLQYIQSNRLDFLTRSFIERINTIKPIFTKSLSEIVTERRLLTDLDVDNNKIKEAEKIIYSILKGSYQYDKDGEKLFYDNNRYVKLNFSSSGQQEALWILHLLFLLILEQENVFIVIEEPEAHLYPEAQKNIVRLIALLANTNSSQILITTHSPYILAAFNNLMLANNVGQTYPLEVVQRFNKNLWINRNNVYAALVDDGVITDIIDDEFNLIQQEVIDDASRQINNEFDYLYQLTDVE